ncbi:MAG: tRNA (adenosine(37)-N6)-threonylcarbamoyltransferase complex ATPase subunit type 1 TsaE [Verrucomicrobiota bacterium]
MIISHSADETIAFGRQLAGSLRTGDVLALTGDLGAGKTCLVKGLATGLGITHAVTSPTFTLIHEYRGGRLPLAHIDLYRLATASEAINIGIEEYLGGAGVTVVEWAERIESLLPAQTRRIHLTVIDETTRQIEMT